jgi:hypothetical protein
MSDLGTPNPSAKPQANNLAWLLVVFCFPVKAELYGLGQAAGWALLYSQSNQGTVALLISPASC